MSGISFTIDSFFLLQYIERFINESEHGVVLFSWGSLIKTATIPKYKEDIIMNALSKIKQRVIWKYENSDEEGTLIGNILKVKWIPQYDLLSEYWILHNYSKAKRRSDSFSSLSILFEFHSNF